MKENDLIHKVMELFMHVGIKSLTMDEISRQLRISKKTLYKHVTDKIDLVNKSMLLFVEIDQKELTSLNSIDGNAIDKMVAINDMVSERLENVQPAVIFDLRTYYPEAWNIMELHKSEFICQQVKSNIVKGINEGIYRDNVDPELTSKIYLTLLHAIFETNLFDSESKSVRRIHTEIARYHLRGIANRKGLDYMKTVFNNIKY